MAQTREEEDEPSRDARREINAAQHHHARIPGQIARTQEKPEEHLDRVQVNYGEQENERQGNKRACNTKNVPDVKQRVKEATIGSWYHRGGRSKE